MTTGISDPDFDAAMPIGGTTSTPGSHYRHRLEEFISRIAVASHVEHLAKRCSFTVEYTKLLLDTYCNEARVGLALVEPSLRPGLRILEVGSGIGLLASVIACEGIDIVGIEPGSAGFGFMPALTEIVASCCGSPKPFASLPMDVADLTFEHQGSFDLIYSVNVLEHLLELEHAVAGMNAVLAPGGTMVHMCPNYAVPYEPHLMIPLIPGVPHLTRHLFPQRAKRYPGLWEGLNFITARRLARISRQNGLAVEFDRHVMTDMVRRILTDQILANRQGKLIKTLAMLIERTGALAIVDLIPPTLSTPMVARFAKP